MKIITNHHIRQFKYRAVKDAERIHYLDIAEAKEYPGMLGKILPAMLNEYGWYAAKIDGVNTYFERK